MTLPAPNIPLLRKAVEWAEAEAAKIDEPSLWDQTAYARTTDCGTAFCIAGWTVATASPDAVVQPSPNGYGEQPGEHLTAIHPDGTAVAWEREAGTLLGLTDSESWDLFDPDNNIDRVRRIAEGIAGRVGERL